MLFQANYVNISNRSIIHKITINLLQELKLGGTGFSCYDPCYERLEEDAAKYGYVTKFPVN